jgi:hypothetical protein
VLSVLPIVFAVTSQVATAPTVGAVSSERTVASRRYGIHLGLNATLTFDATWGRWVYTGLSTQLTGLGALFDPERNYVVSALVFAGVALPLVEREAFRLTVDGTPSVGFLRSAPVHFVTVGLLAGLRLVHRSGFTVALRLPVLGYAGAPQAARGSVYYYYLSAIPTVPLVSLGYTF